MIVRSEPCQAFNLVGAHPAWRRSWLGYGVRAHVRQLLKGERSRLGAASRFAEGQWVRVLERPTIERTLDASGSLRGLRFLPYQWVYCGGVYRVQKVVRRILDDHRIGRPISRTVLLEGVTCTGPATGMRGCGRRCPLMFRDEWLEPADAPAQAPPGCAGGAYVRVRSAEEIRASLNRWHKRDGLTFMPEMYQWAGRRLRVLHQVTSVLEFDSTVPAARRVFILEGPSCSGAVLGQHGPCDRACPILWHADWLSRED